MSVSMLFHLQREKQEFRVHAYMPLHSYIAKKSSKKEELPFTNHVIHVMHTTLGIVEVGQYISYCQLIKRHTVRGIYSIKK